MSGQEPRLGGDRGKRTGSEPGLSVEVTLPKLIAALDDPDIRSRLRAIEALGRTHDPRALHPLLNVLHSEDRQMRAAAAEALGHLGDPLAVADLLEVMDMDEWPLTRAAAALALGRIGHADAAFPLQRSFRDRDNMVSEAAYEALQMVRHRMMRGR
jgi:HEAT repeat protein